MKFNEKIQYKLRNFLYEQDRRRNQKVKSYNNLVSGDVKEEGTKTKFIEAIEEMDTFLGEKMKGIQSSKRKKQ